ncbi:MAG: hypothetical protein WBK19_10415 [Azonexus sp.]
MNARLNNDGQQMTLDFEPSLVERHSSALSCVRQCAYSLPKRNLKWIAGEMDLSESDLSRKLAQNENDSRRFTLDDLESFVEKTGDKTPILYLAAKYLADQQMLKQAAMQKLMRELPDFMDLVKTLVQEKA